MKWRTSHLWILIGLCIFGTLCVDSFEYEKIKSRNHYNKPSAFEKNFPDIHSINEETDRLTEDASNIQQRNIENETTKSLKNKNNQASKIHNKKHLLHQKSEEINHAKRENFFFRLFSDNYKPHKERPVVRKKRDSNGIIRKLEIINDTFYPQISHSVIPISHFGRDRKINDDKICKTQIIKFYPKQLRKTYDIKNDISNESHRQLLFNDNNNEWELRQNIFVEEILPFREKNDFGFKDVFHDEAKTIFDDILSIFTMLPFSIFDTIYVKLSTTEKPKALNDKITPGNIEHSESDVATSVIDLLSQRRRRQANEDTTLANSKQGTQVDITNENGTPKDNLAVDSAENNTLNNVEDANEVKTSNKTIQETDKTKQTTTIELKIANESTQQTNHTKQSTTGLTSISLESNKHSSSSTSNPVSFINNQTTGTHTFKDMEKSKNLSDSNVAATTEKSKGTTTVAELSKLKVLNPKENLLGLQENDDHYNENIAFKNVESVEDGENSGSDKNAFLLVLGVIPGLIGLIIAVGVVGIWFIQKNSSWFERNNQGSEPTTSSQGKPGHSCNI